MTAVMIVLMSKITKKMMTVVTIEVMIAPMTVVMTVVMMTKMTRKMMTAVMIVVMMTK